MNQQQDKLQEYCHALIFIFTVDVKQDELQKPHLHLWHLHISQLFLGPCYLKMDLALEMCLQNIDNNKKAAHWIAVKAMTVGVRV